MPKCTNPNCPDPWHLKKTEDYMSVISGKLVEWFECPVCKTQVETVDGMTTPDEVNYVAETKI